jgi:hypothetical protein
MQARNFLIVALNVFIIYGENVTRQTTQQRRQKVALCDISCHLMTQVEDAQFEVRTKAEERVDHRPCNTS